MGSILITGGTGTLGHALVKGFIEENHHPNAFRPIWKRIVVFSRDEVKQAQMTLEEGFGASPQFRAFLGDVRDYDRLVDAMHGIDVVIAAAALKRVDATAYNPSELLKTNVIGVENTIRAAVAAGVKKVVVVSSDKAVAPSTPYGVSKAMAETIATTSNTWAFPRGTKVSVVRYGNVLGSRGSVVHLWRQQVAKGEPITVTDERMSRFIMTVEEAVALIRWTMANMQGGEIVVPVIPSARLGDLAEAIAPGHPLKTIGIRDGGEKVSESLLAESELGRLRIATNTLGQPYFIVPPAYRDWSSEPFRWEPWFTGPYTSDANIEWLSAAAIRERLAETEVVG